MQHGFNIELFKQGDEDAYNFIYDQYYPPIYLVAFLMLKNEKEAEDQTQKAFIELLDRRHLFETEKGINDFLFIVTRNACIDVIRKKKGIRIITNLFLSQNFNADHSLYDHKVEAETFEELYKALENLPPRQKEIFILSCRDGLKIREIANHLNISEKTVADDKRKALSYLRQVLLSIILSITIMLLPALCATQL